MAVGFTYRKLATHMLSDIAGTNSMSGHSRAQAVRASAAASTRAEMRIVTRPVQTGDCASWEAVRLGRKATGRASGGLQSVGHGARRLRCYGRAAAVVCVRGVGMIGRAGIRNMPRFFRILAGVAALVAVSVPLSASGEVSCSDHRISAKAVSTNGDIQAFVRCAAEIRAGAWHGGSAAGVQRGRALENTDRPMSSSTALPNPARIP